MYVMGPDGSNQCSEGSMPVSAASCQSAAGTLSKAWGGSLGDAKPDYPRACYLHVSTDRVYFNPDLVGAGHAGSQPVCIVSTTAAPTTASPTTATPTTAAMWGTAAQV
jgi:hypothetical protein